MNEKLKTPLRILHDSLTKVIDDVKKSPTYNQNDAIIIDVMDSILDSIRSTGMDYEKSCMVNVYLNAIQNDIEGFDSYYMNNFESNHDLMISNIDKNALQN